MGSPMKNYKVHRVLHPMAYGVHEAKTEHVIESYPDSRTAKLQANRFNGGAGFNGWTPRWFIEAKQ